jgi:hypothetical protein
MPPFIMHTFSRDAPGRPALPSYLGPEVLLRKGTWNANYGIYYID